MCVRALPTLSASDDKDRASSTGGVKSRATLKGNEPPGHAMPRFIKALSMDGSGAAVRSVNDPGATTANARKSLAIAKRARPTLRLAGALTTS